MVASDSRLCDCLVVTRYANRAIDFRWPISIREFLRIILGWPNKNIFKPVISRACLVSILNCSAMLGGMSGRLYLIVLKTAILSTKFINNGRLLDEFMTSYLYNPDVVKIFRQRRKICLH